MHTISILFAGTGAITVSIIIARSILAIRYWLTSFGPASARRHWGVDRH